MEAVPTRGVTLKLGCSSCPLALEKAVCVYLAPRRQSIVCKISPLSCFNPKDLVGRGGNDWEEVGMKTTW